MFTKLYAGVFLQLIALVNAQLSGHVGPLTSFKAKATTKICDVTDYGAVNDGKTDSGPAIQSAWSDCKVGGLVYIPTGSYALKTFVSFTGGEASAVQLDGTLIRASDDYADQMINIRNCADFELFSGNSKGALQGYGYEMLQNGDYGPRFFRIQDVTNFSVHGFAAIDSAAYYFVFDNCKNGEIYNIIVRGISVGMTDAFDLWGENLWVHDIEVTNGDECVTVKSPAKNFLIENIYCNLSGGTAIGSLLHSTDIHDIYYKHLYLNRADACYLKTNNGNGTVKNVVWDTVIVHQGPYPLAINEAWGTDRGSEGVLVHNLTFKNWHGQEATNSRPVIRLEGDPDVPCYDINVSNVNLWTADGDYVKWSCQNAYGSGACLKSASNTKSLTTYTTVSTISTKPYYATSYMPSDLSSPYPSTTSFTIPPVPTTFYPGQTPYSKLLSLSRAGGL